jgi:hypothetical protein
MTRDDAALAHWQLVKSGDLPMFAVYNSPAEFPGKYVVRLWRSRPEPAPTYLVETFNTLEQAREFIPRGLVCLSRAAIDEPEIVEVWM